MLNEKLIEVMSHPADGEVAIVTQGNDGPHVVNTWNSYVNVTADGKLLIPAGRIPGLTLSGRNSHGQGLPWK